jgi:hypothetical protein
VTFFCAQGPMRRGVWRLVTRALLPPHRERVAVGDSALVLLTR